MRQAQEQAKGPIQTFALGVTSTEDLLCAEPRSTSRSWIGFSSPDFPQAACISLAHYFPPRKIGLPWGTVQELS